MNQENYYQILGVSENATEEQIKQAYRSLCKNLHPDTLPPDASEDLKKLAEKRIKMIINAYSTLNNKSLRREYDLKISNKPSYSEPDNEFFKTARYEELLSDTILEQGLNDLVIEEKELYNNFYNEIKIIQEHYKDYLSKVFNSDLNDFYPDNLIFRINKLLKIFYLYIPFIFIIFLSFGKIAVNIFDFIFYNLFRKPFVWDMQVMGLFGIVSFLLLINMIFEGFKDKYEDSKYNKTGSYYFSGKLKGFHERFMDFGWDIKFLHFRKPLYKDSYVSEIRKKTDKFKKQFKGLNSSRKNLLDKFKNLNPHVLENLSYIENLSYSERFLLIKALEEKLKEEKDAQSRNNALKVAGAVGLVALFVASGGNIGP